MRDAIKKLLYIYIPLLPQSALFLLKQYPHTLGMDYPGVKMVADSNAEASRTRSSKEPGTVAWIETFAPGDIFYDIGANTGPYSLVAAKHLGTQSTIYSFEPHPQSYAKLCKNIILNQFEHVVPFGFALSDTTGLLPFNYRWAVEGSSGHALGEALDSEGREFAPLAMHYLQAYRLDDCVKEFKLAPPTHIKIDVDGIELKILAGAERTIASPTLKSVLVELEKNEQETAQAVQLFAKHGFTLKGVFEGRNHLFVR